MYKRQLWVSPVLEAISYNKVSSRITATAAVLPAVSMARMFIREMCIRDRYYLVPKMRSPASPRPGMM